ncbi:DUF1444 family protein [Macrococcus armenti]|uniref:DUF1444 family protein n=1 Tax=Macrococcus armenti TaxID=2875764 RepID=UPI001CC930D0|nr:DUF1444 family protein [Macrococcus armenti]UBH07983.1 DUF1444 domain-containing protein [Macrococcus armenti]UBH10215.1 DUF1444 domain-containing protein [Macrococcus armenti]
MNVFEIRDYLKDALKDEAVTFQFDRKEETLRIERNDNKKGLTLKLAPVAAKYKEKKEKILEEVLYYIRETIHAFGDVNPFDDKPIIMPVVRATSFQKEQNGIPFLITEHTAETNIYYAVDLGNTYRLIDEEALEKLNLSESHVKEQALFNLNGLSNPYKTDIVSGNTYYFFNSNDGYDASRLLNKQLLKSFRDKITGEMLVAVPHGDVLIIADIQNETGYDVLAQMTMQFFANGLVPITSLSFQYEDGTLTPVFILGKNNAKRNQEAIQRIEANRKKFEQEKKDKEQ